MMKRILYIVVGLFVLMPIRAEEQKQASKAERYDVSVGAEYAYNHTLGSYANFDVLSTMPIHRYFEMEAAFQASTANEYTAGIVLRPKYALRVGELFVDGQVLYKGVVRAGQSDLAWGLSVGYRMDYVRVQVGWSGRVLSMKNNEGVCTRVLEPINILYRVDVCARPQTCNWNIHVCGTNYDDFQIERMTEPLFMLGGRYDPTAHWRVSLDVICKPSGIFHVNANFYEAMVRAKATYSF